MAGVSNEAQTFAAIITYFVCVTFLIGLSPLNDGTNFIGFSASNGNCSTATAWSTLTTYKNGDCVTSGGKTWKSTANSNLNNAPSSSSNFWADQTSIGSGFSTVAKVGTGAACAASAAVGILTSVLSFGASLVLSGVTCSAFLFTALAPANVADSVATAVSAIFSFMYVFFELITFQLPIPAFLNLLIIAPGAAPTVYIGLKVYRGGG